jgi:predicted nucleic-acid-binding Zn-ribbon protein
MRDGKCAKCGAATVRAARNGISDSAGHTTMQENHEGRLRGIVRPFLGEAWQFACTSCGYLEWYVLDPATIAHIEGTWFPVEPSG